MRPQHLLAGVMLCLGVPPLLAQDPRAADSVLFQGTVTNRGYDGMRDGWTSSLLMILGPRDKEVLYGDLQIGAPLGGSGRALVRAWGDTLLVLSISPSGDSIGWLGRRDSLAREVAGVYRIHGGPYRGQGGYWRAAIPSRLGRLFLRNHEADPRPSGLAGVNLATVFAPFAPVLGSAGARASRAPDPARAPAAAGPPTYPTARLPQPTTAHAVAPAILPRMGWPGWGIGVPLLLFGGWVASFGRDLRLLREDRRVLLALVFVPGLYVVLALSVVLMLGVAAGVLWLLWKQAEASHRIPVGVMFAIVVGAIYGLWSVLAALWHSVQRAEVAVHAEQLTPETAPALYGMLERLARRLSAARPDSVVLEMGMSFFVTEANVRTFTGTCGRRTLCLSAPLLHVLTAPEVEAILAHELAHFSGADTAYSRRFYPVYRGAARALAGMDAVDGDDASAASLPLLLPRLLVGGYLTWFARLERRNSREREFRADRLAGEATAPTVMASALLKVHAYAPFWDAVLQGVRGLHAEGRSYINGAVAFEQARERPGLLAAARTGEAHALTHPTDTHPSLADRLAALGFPDRATAPLGEGPSATHLVADLAAREERLTDAVTYLVLHRSGLLPASPSAG